MNLQTRRTFLQTAAAAPSALTAAQPKKPNVIILFTDDMGYGDLACYGNPVIRTPNLDRMAREGMRFTSFYAAASVCTPSRTGLLTGRYPTRAGQPNNTGPDTVGGLPLSEILLPQILKKRGYRTMAIGKWHLGYKPAEHLPTSRGFDSFFGLPYSNDMIPPWVKTNQPLELYRDAKPIEQMNDQSTLTDRYTAEALRFIQSAKKDPFFLYLPYAMPHLPISAAERFRGKSRAGLYGDTIENIDWSVGEILRTLKRERLDSNTIVVFASDNGPWHNLPSRMLANGVERWYTGSKSLLRGAKGTTYEGGFRVPGIVRWAGQIPAGQVSAEMASTLDLLPTIAHAAGADIPSDRVYDGSDIMPMLRSGGQTPRKDFYYHLGRRLDAVREGAWKYRYAPSLAGEEQAPGPPVHELFHLDQDPAEMYNLYDRERTIADRLGAKLRAFGSEVKATLPDGPAAR